MNKLIITLIIFCLPILCSSQTFQMGTTIGFSNYQGDIASKNIWSPREFNPSFSGFFKYNINEKWAFRANLLLTELTGDDLNHVNENAWRATRAIKFRTPIQEISMNAEWKFLNKPIPTMGFHPYIFVGVGLTFSDPVTNISVSTPHSPESQNPEDPNPEDPNSAINNLSSKQNDLVIPFGIGCYYDLDNRFTIGMEVSSRKLFTDNLDGVVTLGNDKKQDWYTNVAITMAYQFGKDWDVKKRPKYKRK